MTHPEDQGPIEIASASGAAQVVAFLTNFKTIIGLVGAIVLAAVPIAQNACKLPVISRVCSPSPPATADAAMAGPAPALTEADIEKRVAALNVQRNTELESVGLKVYHQPPAGDPLVQSVIVGLRAAGFNVGLNLNEAQTNLANVLNVDRTPGMVWIKSVATRKDLRRTAREAILKALPTSYDRVKISDVDIPDRDAAAIQRAGEIQVDVF